MTGAPSPRHPRLRLVERRQLPRFEVRNTAADGRAPFGRSRAFHLTHDELDELIAVAVRMVRRP